MDGHRDHTQHRHPTVNAGKHHLLSGARMLRKPTLLALLGGLLVAVGLLLWIRQPGQAPQPAVPPEWIARLTGTRIETAMANLDQGRPDEALALLASALKDDPAAAAALALVEKILLETTWHVPVVTLAHPLPIERIEFAAPSSMWVGLAGEQNTIVRWNLETLSIESVLFPLHSMETRSLVLDPSRRRMVVERAGIALLCDAMSLKPIKDLGTLPDFVTPSSVIAFSADGLLMAHPALVSGQEPALIWHLRDAASGEILRSIELAELGEPGKAATARPLAAFLDRRALHVLHADGGTLEIPVSPMDPLVHKPASETTSLHHAQFSSDGKSALVQMDHGPHRAPELKIMPPDGEDVSLQPTALLERFPWNLHPGIWSGLLRDSPSAPLTVDGARLDFTNSAHSPVHASSLVTAVAASGTLRVVGEKNGTLTIHQLLPHPDLLDHQSNGSAAAGPAAIAAFENLTTALAGLRHDEEKRSFIRVPADERLRCFDACDFKALGALLPRLDFSPLTAARGTMAQRSPEPGAFKPLMDRFARANPDLSAAESSKATLLAMALESEQPASIGEMLRDADDLPPILRKLAVSRIAWLEGRRGDALAGWPEVFPELAKVRLREDWDGWEQADFNPAFEKLRLCMMQELSSLKLPENPSPAQIQAVIERITHPETLRSVGRARLAQASLDAALALTPIPGQAEDALKLALLAGSLGAPTEPRLRAEALALGALGDYPKARDRWVLLLTEHPLETHQPADYTEAAYTAFEAADPAQAMEILTTGLHRYPADVDFALRAGWIALLSGNSDRAYRFLLTGRQNGFPPAKLENATALLAIAAAQAGAGDDAVVFHQELIAINPAWQEAATIEALDWPEEMKSTLLHLSW